MKFTECIMLVCEGQKITRPSWIKNLGGTTIYDHIYMKNGLIWGLNRLKKEDLEADDWDILGDNTHV